MARRAARPWYRDAVIYELPVRAFADSNGDGIGDFDGVTSRLDHLSSLGVTAIWLLPFYPSPHRDGGYDISDYRRVDPAYGDLRAFRRLLRAAHERDIRVITELVLNHTSDQHAWFQRARRSPAGSKWRDYYVWSDTTDSYADARVIFKDFETSNWTWDPVANAYFWHRFYSHQPDLNYENPAVQDEMLAVLDHWLAMGVDGIRLDAVPYLYEREGTMCENLPETHAFLRRLRAHIDANFSEKMLLAEANQWPDDAATYFGAGDECHMNFHFPLMPRLFMAIRQENRTPIVDILDQTPPLPPGCEWATFLRNHDELTLEMVTDEERDYMYRSYAADPQMRLNLGIRRRLAPLLGNDRRKIELMNALLFSLPGTPVIYYGDEIGMGDNVYLGDRDGVRTPMQWSADRNAGFSRASPQRLYLPPVVDGPYHYETVNVENQRHDPTSLLSWLRQLVSVRQRHAVLTAGDITFLEPDNHRVLAFVRHLEDEIAILMVANLSERAQSVELDLRRYGGATLIEVFGQTPFAPVGEWPYYLTLAPYGFYWFELRPRPAHDRDDDDGVPHLDQDWLDVVARGGRPLVPALDRWIRKRRWFAGKGRPVTAMRVASVLEAASHQATDMRIVLVEVAYADGGPDVYVVPLTAVDGDAARLISGFRPEAVVATLAGDRVVVDALNHEPSVLDLVDAMVRRRRVGPLHAEPYPELRTLGPSPAVRVLSAEQSNSSVVLDEAVIVKLLRRLQGGLNPDVELSRHLRDVGFENTAPLLGSLGWRHHGDVDTMAVAYRFVPNDGDAWVRMLDLLDSFFADVVREEIDEALPPVPPLLGPITDAQRAVLGAAGEDLDLLGRRTAELHVALARGTEPDFAPEPVTVLYQRSLYSGMRSQLRTTIGRLRRAMRHMEGRTQALAEQVVATQDALLGRLVSLRDGRATSKRIRVHGDYHLGQVLFTGRDFLIIDFEGEPGRTISERRIKRPALRDVAGMLRSFDYAAQVALDTRRQRGLVSGLDDDRLDEWARWWRDAAGAAFVAGYFAVPEVGVLMPDSRDDVMALLDAFVLEKALYELNYELDNRPAWVRLPLATLAELAS